MADNRLVYDTPSNALIGTDKYNPMMGYFETNAPASWRNDPGSMAQFEQIYGPQAAGLMKQWGVWEGAQDPNFRPTAEQTARYGSEGQFYNTAPEMAMQIPDNRSGMNLMPGQTMPADQAGQVALMQAYLSGTPQVNATPPPATPQIVQANSGRPLWPTGTPGATGTGTGTGGGTVAEPYYATAGASTSRQTSPVPTGGVASGTPQLARPVQTQTGYRPNPYTTGTNPPMGGTSGQVDTNTGRMTSGNTGGTTPWNPNYNTNTNALTTNNWQNPNYQPSNPYPQSMNPDYKPQSDLNAFFSGNGPQAWQWLENAMQTGMINNGERFNQQANELQNYLQQYNPQMLTEPLVQMLSQWGADPNAAMLGGNAQQLLGGNLQIGPNGEISYGGTGNYGIQTLLQQIMQYGLPGQSTIEGMVPGQNALGTTLQGQGVDWLTQLGQGQNVGSNALQNQLQSQLSGQMQGSGLTPEYVAAMRSSVLDPSQEALLGRINQLSGGASLNSPAYQEMMRRNEQEFTNQMITQGFNNLNNVQGQAANLGAQQFGQGSQVSQLANQYGQQGIGNSLNAFGSVAQNVSPYANMASNLTTQLAGLNQNQQFGTYDRGANLLNQNLSTQLGLNDQLLRQYLGQMGTYGGLTENLLNNQTSMKNTQTAADAAAGAARGNATGNLVAQGVNAGTQLLFKILGEKYPDVFGGYDVGNPSSYPGIGLGWTTDASQPGGGYWTNNGQRFPY